MITQRRPAGRALLRESALRAMVRLLLESRALRREADRLSAAEGNVRQDEWDRAAEALEGVPAAAEMLRWLAKPLNVPEGKPLGEFVPLLKDWARARDEKRLQDGEDNLSSLSLKALRNVSLRMSIGRAMEARVPREGHLFEVRGDAGTVWDVYFPTDPGESCAVARLVSPGNTDYKIPWCTARGKNNFFFGYAAGGILLYYVVNRNRPEEKYSLGYSYGLLLQSVDNSATVDWRNKAFVASEAFGSAWPAIKEGTEQHANGLAKEGHPALGMIADAAEDAKAWRELLRRTSDDVQHEYMLYRHLVSPTAAGRKGRELRSGLLPMHPEVALGFLSMAARIDPGGTGYVSMLRDPIERVAKEHGKHYPGSRAEAEVKKVLAEEAAKREGRAGGDTVAALIARITRAPGVAEEPGTGDALSALRSLAGSIDDLDFWIEDHIDTIMNRRPQSQQQRSANYRRSKEIAAAMSPRQLLTMVWPYDTFSSLNGVIPTSDWAVAGWSALALESLMRQGASGSARDILDAFVGSKHDAARVTKIMEKGLDEMPPRAWGFYEDLKVELQKLGVKVP